MQRMIVMGGRLVNAGAIRDGVPGGASSRRTRHWALGCPVLPVNAQMKSLVAFGAIGVAAAALVWFWIAGDAGADETPGPAQPGAPVAEATEPQPAAASRSLAPIGNAEPALLQVRGRILDAWGEPVVRALVGDVASDRPVATAADGRFELLAARGSRLSLLVLAVGHAPLLASAEVSGGAHDAGDLQLQRGGGIRGKVVDGAKNGIAGATVTLRVQSSPWPPSIDLARLFPPATTDASGAFAFAHLPPGNYRVAATASGKQSAQSGAVAVRDGVETAVDPPLVLAAAYELSGLVLGAGAPVGGAQVRIRAGNQPAFAGESAADGRFRAVSLPPGPLRVEVSKPGFLQWVRTDVDATRDEEVVVHLVPGLSITGRVVEASSGKPVERFAVLIRRTGELDPGANGSIQQQLQRQVAELRAAAAGAADPEQRAERLQIASEFEARLEALARLGPRPPAVPADVGPVEPRPGGKFVSEGLDEGTYTVGISSLDHQFAQIEPVELRRGTPAPELRFELVPGATLAGVVVSRHDRSPVGGATVELVRPQEAQEAEDAQRSLYPWVFARSGPQGITLRSARTAADGSFEFRQAAPGRYFLSIHHAGMTDFDTAVFDFVPGSPKYRVEVGARATLAGRVLDASPGQSVSVLVLGGHGMLRTVQADAAGRYRFDYLQAGSYLVRAFPSDSGQYVNRLFGAIFPLHAGGVDPKQIPERDVTLGEGETRVFDLALDVPATGTVQGRLLINGQPGKGAQAIVRPLPGEAPGSGGLALRGACDDLGRFTIPDVPAGKYTLSLGGASRQELHSEPLTVAPNQTTLVERDLAAGGLRGRVVVPDPSTEETRGYVWVLPGITEAPADLYEYRRTKRTHRIQVRNGAFEDASLTPGPAIAVVDIRGRSYAVAKIVIPARETLAVDLAAGPRSQ
jgi:hypothetical protein